MELRDTKNLLRIYEDQEQLGVDQVMSLMMVFMKDVRNESGKRVSELTLISEPGNERALLDSLQSVAIETVNIMKKINPEDMDGLESRFRRVCDKEAGVQKVADTIEQWKQEEEACREVIEQIENEEKHLQKRTAELQKLKEQKKTLQEMVTSSCMTEEACKAEIERLKKLLSTVPEAEHFKELQDTLKGVKNHYGIINTIVSDFLEDHSEETRLEMKFTLSEDKCREHLQTIAEHIGELEKYYSDMLKHLDNERTLKEAEYAGY